jgi:hypothetical protein
MSANLKKLYQKNVVFLERSELREYRAKGLGTVTEKLSRRISETCWR